MPSLQTARKDQRIVRAVPEPAASVLEDVVDDRVEGSKRQPEFRRDERHRPGEATGRHADDGEVASVDLHRAADEAELNPASRQRS